MLVVPKFGDTNISVMIYLTFANFIAYFQLIAVDIVFSASNEGKITIHQYKDANVQQTTINPGASDSFKVLSDACYSDLFDTPLANKFLQTNICYPSQAPYP